jgi:hypothetical protein
MAERVAWRYSYNAHVDLVTLAMDFDRGAGHEQVVADRCAQA